MAKAKWDLRYAILKGSVGLLLLLLSGCKGDRSMEGRMVTSDLDFKSYVHSVIAANGSKDASFYFPLLQIFDEQGRLVYVGHDAKQNSAIMSQIPGNLVDLRPIPNGITLSSIMGEVPAFKPQQNAFIGGKRGTVLSVFLEDCHACSVQEKALDDNQKQLLKRGTNLLVLNVTKPA
jgi:hypothetical protein